MADRTNPGVRYEKLTLPATLSPPCRAVIIASAGVINGIAVGSQDQVNPTVTGTLPVGWHPIQFSYISDTTTDVGEITAVW